MRYLFVLLVISCLFGCKREQTTVIDPDCGSGVSITGDEETDTERLNLLELEVLALLDRSCSNQNKCRIIAFGTKPCGGPWTYLIYSKSATDESLLIDKVCEYNALQDAMNKQYGYVSDCAVIDAPELNCADGNCEIAY